MKIELITWHDAGSADIDEDNVWKATDDVEDDNPVIRSVGWIVKETERNVTIALDLADDGSTNGRSRIPKGMIVERRVIHDSEK